jgi:hypothetical protein
MPRCGVVEQPLHHPRFTCSNNLNTASLHSTIYRRLLALLPVLGTHLAPGIFELKVNFHKNERTCVFKFDGAVEFVPISLTAPTFLTLSLTGSCGRQTYVSCGSLRGLHNKFDGTHVLNLKNVLNPAWVCADCTISSTVPTFLTLRTWVPTFLNLFQKKNKKYKNEKFDTKYHMQHNISHTIQISNTLIYVHITNSHKSKYISSQIHISPNT